MPRYQYKCSACELLTTINHLSTETRTECPHCFTENTLIKMLTSFTTAPKSTVSTPQKTGDLTEDQIKESREDLARQKEELSKKRK